MRRSQHGLRRIRTRRRQAIAIVSGSLSMPALHTKRWRRVHARTWIAWQRVTRRPRGKPSSSVSSKKGPDLKLTSGKWAGGERALMVNGISSTGVASPGLNCAWPLRWTTQSALRFRLDQLCRKSSVFRARTRRLFDKWLLPCLGADSSIVNAALFPELSPPTVRWNHPPDVSGFVQFVDR